jgi:hypothetical protein
LKLILIEAPFYFFFSKLIFKSFKIFYKEKYLDVVNYVDYESANFQCEIPYNLGSAKKTNLTKSERFESADVHASRSAILFLSRIEYMIFHDENLDKGRIIH